MRSTFPFKLFLPRFVDPLIIIAPLLDELFKPFKVFFPLLLFFFAFFLEQHEPQVACRKPPLPRGVGDSEDAFVVGSVRLGLGLSSLRFIEKGGGDSLNKEDDDERGNLKQKVISTPMYSALIPCLLYTSPSPRDQA
eukprot:TRINITY_DN737_c0_g1_i4.p3 TRINITY_DN737_c0_g1~~TRINITY_DN737_c0_g1_i4.p3  ORF type:complete len:137 (+),score=22.18 TRINITY_DN737_c0_g1_i4:407-817(+)